MAKSPTLAFLRTESGAGAVLVAGALAALLLANSPWSADYSGLVHMVIPVRIGAFGESLTLEAWVRDGLMALFFLVVGLEVKYEVLRGEFSSPRRLAVPILAALGGMAGPAAVYLAVNQGAGGDLAGWPVPTPTDLAFSLAALALFARRLPQSLRVFLLTLAVADDIGAVGLIGVLFSVRLNLTAVAGAGASLIALVLLSRWRKAPRLFYAVGFLLVWAFTLRSGISTSVAGFACAFTVPISRRGPEQESLLKTFQDALHPYVAYLILPLFAFVSAGVSFSGVPLAALMTPPAVGIALGLLIGKPLGVFALTFLAVATRLGRKPMGAAWPEIFGVSLLCGAGFTLSFFLGALAFRPAEQAPVRTAVILASTVAVLAGGVLLGRCQAIREARGEEADD